MENEKYAVRDAPPAGAREYADRTPADQVRALLLQANLSQRGAARELDINERTMRDYCSGGKVPRVVILALERLVDMQRQVGGERPAGFQTVVK